MSSSFQSRLGTAPEEAIKAPCRAATTANITLSGEQTIDGVSVVAGDRVFVKNQAVGVENGIYVVQIGRWTRAPDWDGPGDVVSGMLISVTEGTISGEVIYMITFSGSFTVGSSTFTVANAVSVETNAKNITYEENTGDRNIAMALDHRVPFVDTLSDLQALDIGEVSDQARLDILGRASANDAGASEFRFRSGDQSANVTAEPERFFPPDSEATGSDGAWELIHFKKDRVGSIFDLVSIPTAALFDGQTLDVRAFYSNTDTGGGHFYWDEDRDKSDANGGTIIDPDNVGTLSDTDLGTFLSQQGTGSGTGCWVRSPENDITPEKFGTHHTNSPDVNDISIQSAIDYIDQIGGVLELINIYPCNQIEFKPGCNVHGIGRFACGFSGLGSESTVISRSKLEDQSFTEFHISHKDNVTGQNIYLWNALGGSESCDIDLLGVAKSGVTKHGIVIHGYDSDTDTFNGVFYNDFWNTRIRVSNFFIQTGPSLTEVKEEMTEVDGRHYTIDDTAGNNASKLLNDVPVAIYLKGYAEEGSDQPQRANWNNLYGAHVMGYPISYRIDEGHGNTLVGSKAEHNASFDEPPDDYEICDILIAGGQTPDTHENMLVNHSFENAPSENRLWVITTPGGINNPPVFAHVVGGRFFSPRNDITYIRSGANFPPVQCSGTRQWQVANTRPDLINQAETPEIHGFAQDGLLQYQADPTGACGGLLLAGSEFSADAFGGSLVALAKAGGASVKVRTGSEIRFVHTNNGSAFSSFFRSDTDGNASTDGTLETKAYYKLADGVSAPTAESGKAKLYVDSADGALKVIFGDGTTKTIVTDS